MDKIYSVTQYIGLVKVNMISVLALKMFVYLDLNHNTKIYLKFLIYELIIRVARTSALLFLMPNLKTLSRGSNMVGPT